MTARRVTRFARATRFALFALVVLVSNPGAAQVAGTPWEGSQDQGASTPADPNDTNLVSFVFHPERSELTTPCEQIAFIQTSQAILDGVPVQPGDDDKGFDFQDDDTIPDLPGTSANESGTCLDDLERDTTPYYQDTAGGAQGTSNGTTTSSTTTDRPRSNGGDRGFGRVQELVYKFEICAFCAKGEDAGHYFGCLTWEFVKTAADHNARPRRRGTSRITGTSQQPSAGFKAAVDRWAANHDFDLPGR